MYDIIIHQQIATIVSFCNYETQLKSENKRVVNAQHFRVANLLYNQNVRQLVSPSDGWKKYERNVKFSAAFQDKQLNFLVKLLFTNIHSVHNVLVCPSYATKDICKYINIKGF